MVVEDAVKTEWEELLKGLLAVPFKARTKVWQKTVDWIQKILSGTNTLAVKISADGVHYAVSCGLCKHAIHIADDFVFHSVEGIYRHYDCNMGYDGSSRKKGTGEKEA